jgi:hypothetical protein
MTIHPRFSRRLGPLCLAVAALAACAPSSAPSSAPSPAPAPAAPARPSAAAVERARADSVRAAREERDARLARDERTARVAREERVAREARDARRRATIAHPSARNDTLAPRRLHASVRVCAGGDVTLGTNLDPDWSRVASERMRTKFKRADDPASLIAPLRPLMHGADVVVVNVESAIGEGPAPAKCGPLSTNCFAFRAPVASAAALRSLAPTRAVVGNLANNHARDAGNAGQDSTVAALRAAGVLVTGDDTLATPVPTPAGDTIGVLGFYTSNETPDARDTAAVYRHVARAVEQFPVVIATMHLGAEGRDAQRTRDTSERYLGIDRGNPIAFADAAVRGGAALVVGHGPHVLRAIEWRDRGALIAYSLGNLLTYGPFVLKEPLNRSAVLCATIDRSGRVRDASLAPTMQLAAGVLERDRGRRAIAIADSLGRLDFPATGARISAKGTLRARTRR